MHKKINILMLHLLIPSGLLLCSLTSNAQVKAGATSGSGLFIFLLIILIIIMLATIMMAVTTKKMVIKNEKRKVIKNENRFTEYLKNLDSDQIETFLKKTLFQGEKAYEAKWRAGKMAELFESKIEYYKKQGFKNLL